MVIEFPVKPLDSAKRLAVMLLLEKHGAIIFSDLYRAARITRGALDSHLKTLEKYAYIYREVRFVNTTARFFVVPTPEGLLALKNAKHVWQKILDLNDATDDT